MYDIKIKNARIRGRKDGLFDVRIRGRSIVAIDNNLSETETQEIDAEG